MEKGKDLPSCNPWAVKLALELKIANRFFWLPSWDCSPLDALEVWGLVLTPPSLVTFHQIVAR